MPHQQQPPPLTINKSHKPIAITNLTLLESNIKKNQNIYLYLINQSCKHIDCQWYYVVLDFSFTQFA